MTRRAYIDWLRGLAVLFMIEWHSVDAWTRLDARESGTFDWLIFFGGWAAPMFLFLAGLSVPLAGESRLKRAADAGDNERSPTAARRAASWSLQKRGWQIFVIAHLFRFFGFLLAPGSIWSGLLKPDILNILGLGIVAVAFCWGRMPAAPQPELRNSKSEHRIPFAASMLWLLGPGITIMLLAPASRVWWWPTLLYSRFEAYIRPVGNLGVFNLFPTAAFIFIGAFVGVLIASPRDQSADRRFHRWLGIGGVAIWMAGWAGSYLPALSSRSEFYTTSMSLVVIRCGVMTAALAVTWLWMQRPTAKHWSPLALFGRTSLFVYLVHVQLAYGLFSGPLHHALSLPAALAAYALLTIVMLVAADLWERRGRGPWIATEIRAAST